jgi:hypothetical protein
MAKFEVRVRLLDVAGHDGYAVRRLVEERLRSAGFSRWLVTSVEVQQPADLMPRPRAVQIPRPALGSIGNAVLISAAAVIGLWFWLALF